MIVHDAKLVPVDAVDVYVADCLKDLDPKYSIYILTQDFWSTPTDQYLGQNVVALGEGFVASWKEKILDFCKEKGIW